MVQLASELIEIFSAIQGEGPIIGRRQIFLRFGQCDVKCVYCDTPLCHVELENARVECTPGRRDFERVANPASSEDILEWLKRLRGPDGRHHSVSLTGGEPLLHPEMIAELGPLIRDMGLLVYLETNGHLVDALRRVRNAVDIVGMDIKLESTAGFPARFDDNRDFLRLAVESGLDVFAKLVVGAETTDDELRTALAVVRDTAPEIPVCLQPVTPFRGVGTPPDPDRMLELDDVALAVLPQVTVIPQTHKMIKQL